MLSTRHVNVGELRKVEQYVNTAQPQEPILLIDDEEQILYAVETILRIAGLGNIVKCSDSRKAESLLSRRSYSVVLLDLTMPFVSGTEILAAIHARYPRLPVIIVTGTANLEKVTECVGYGIYDYLVKPVDADCLVNSIKRALDHHRVTNDDRLMKDLLLSSRFEAPTGPTSGVRDSLSRERMLYKTREEYRALFENMLVPTFVLDSSDHTVVYCNRSFAEFFGSSDPRSVARRKIELFALFGDEDRNTLLSNLAKQNQARNCEVTGVREDGSEFSVIVNCRETDDLAYIEGSFVDVSERKKLERQLYRAHRMEAIGRLAGGVAHDFKNLLMVVSGYAELVLSDKTLSEEGQEGIKHILDACRRAEGVARHLLTIGQQQSSKPISFVPNDLITGMRSSLKRLAGRTTSFTMELDPTLGNVFADRRQMEQVILNLYMNAIDAVDDEGEVRIKTENTALSHGNYGEPLHVPPGEYVIVSVTDNGVGMDGETIGNAFDPFFTTKENGTGMGLATVFATVKQSGGHITVDSQVNSGTTIAVYLPRVDGRETAP